MTKHEENYKRYVLIEWPGLEKSEKRYDEDEEWQVGSSVACNGTAMNGGPCQAKGTVFYVGWECGVCEAPGYPVPTNLVGP